MKVNSELRSRRCKNTTLQRANITKMQECAKQRQTNSQDSNSGTDFKHDNVITTVPFRQHPSLKRVKAATTTLPSIEKLQIAKRPPPALVMIPPSWPSRINEEHANVPKALSGGTVVGGPSCKTIQGGITTTTTTTTTKLSWSEQRVMQSQLLRSRHHEQQPLNGEMVLRGGNESPPVEMSGGMQPPIVTVDDINVPVFIDEYLQCLSAAQEIPNETGSTASLASYIGSNTMCCDNNSNNIEGEMLKNLEFDFEMITSEDEEEIMKGNNHMVGGTMVKNKSNNNDINTTSISVENNIYNINIENAYSNNKNRSNDMMIIGKKEEDYYTQCLTSADIEVNAHRDIIDLCLDMNDVLYNEDAVNINAINNDNYSFSEAFRFSQSTDTHPLFSDCLGGIPFCEELDDAKRMIPNIDNDAEYEMCINQQPCKSDDEVANKCTFHDEVEVVLPPLEETKERTTSLLRKPLSTTSSRSSSPTSTSTSFSAMRANRNSSYNNNRKHLKLQLVDPRLQSLDNSDGGGGGGDDTVTTPYLINLLSNWGKEGGVEYTPFTNTTPEEIRRDLLNISRLTPPPESASPTTTGTRNNGGDGDDDDWWKPSTMVPSNCPSSVATDSPQSITSSFSACAEEDIIPPTPQSYNSSCYQTTSPNSPALSSTTTVTTSTAKSTKSTRRRGRPSKEHSDWPDQSQLQELSDVDRKRLQDRAKNNEASRLSRLKNKQRGENEIKEEEQLICRNIELKAELKRLNRIVTKLRRALQRCHFIAREGEWMES